MKKRGFIHIYCGSGKGKTTASLGQGLRFCGWNKKVVVFQFLKKKSFPSGEIKALERFGKNFKIIRFNQEHPMFRKSALKLKSPADCKLLNKSILDSLKYVKQIMASEKYDLVILDEVLNAIEAGFIKEKVLIDLIRKKPTPIELILTGRTALPGITKIADYVSKIKEIKHPFRYGAKARKGIEY